MYTCVKLNEKDTVATVTRAVKVGEDITYKFKGQQYCLSAITNIPMYHKVALENMNKGDVVMKYGCKIGYALMDIKAGEHVHTHNLDSKIID